MQYPHCAHLDYILFGKNRGAQRYRCLACRRTFQTLRRGKNPAFKEQTQKLYLGGLGLRAIGRILGCTIKRFPAGLLSLLGSYQ